MFLSRSLLDFCSSVLSRSLRLTPSGFVCSEPRQTAHVHCGMRTCGILCDDRMHPPAIRDEGWGTLAPISRCDSHEIVQRVHLVHTDEQTGRYIAFMPWYLWGKIRRQRILKDGLGMGKHFSDRKMVTYLTVFGQEREKSSLARPLSTLLE